MQRCLQQNLKMTKFLKFLSLFFWPSPHNSHSHLSLSQNFALCSISSLSMSFSLLLNIFIFLKNINQFLLIIQLGLFHYFIYKNLNLLYQPFKKSFIVNNLLIIFSCILTQLVFIIKQILQSMFRACFSTTLSHSLIHRLKATFTYRNYLSDHVTKIIEQKPSIYQKCSERINQMIKQKQGLNLPIQEKVQLEEVKMKANMLFRIYSLPEALHHYKQQLSDQVVNNHIKNQSELDRVCGILAKEVKSNKAFALADVQKMKKSPQAERLEFVKELQNLKSVGQSFSINEVSKELRSKFMTIESKQIYQQLKELQQEMSNLTENNQIKMKQKSRLKKKEEHQFWDKLKNIKPRLLSEQCNDPKIYEEHKKITNNKLRFRFPPEPNGYLHIGHIKSIRINFQTAKRYGGVCFLRYDDTNPQTQSHEYIQNILKNVKWLGYEPDYITYASDYFQQMIQFAITLIKSGHAYVCDSPQIQIQRERKEKMPNSYRDRTVQESLGMFPNLKQGQTLRLKLDPSSKNPTLRDPVIYRIKDQQHPRTGTKYRVYPIYDFAHCICDSLQHIDYSLCSLEFEVRRQLYYKILDLLNLYKPIVWEYSRLNVEGSVISKRKIKALIQSNAIESWSDPRLLTIGGLMNRGYKPQMLLNFIDKVNASRSGNQNIVQFSLLQRQMRQQLFRTSQKSMMVIKPCRLIIQNLSNQVQTNVELYTDSRKQTRKIILQNSVYVQKDQEGVQIGKIVVLKYIGPFQITSIISNQKGETILKAIKIDQEVKKLKEKGHELKIIHWISEIDCCVHPAVIFNRLLDEDGKVNENSRVIYEKSVIPKDILRQKDNLNKYWQMERLGYFKFDQNGNLIRCAALQ